MMPAASRTWRDGAFAGASRARVLRERRRHCCPLIDSPARAGSLRPEKDAGPRPRQSSTLTILLRRGTSPFFYAFLGDVQTGLRHAARLNELAPGSSWGLELEIILRVQAGDLASAAALVRTGAVRFNDVSDFLRAKAYFHTAKGEYAEALDALLTAMPSFREAAPVIGWGPSFWESPRAVFLHRQTGSEAQAGRIADAFTRGADGYYKPLEGQEQGPTLWVRARMAAVTGDRAQVIANLTQLYDTGGILPAFVPAEPWFQPYRGDPAVAALFAKFDARRAEARRQLGAEGL